VAEAGHHSPPVMLTVCNRTETAARIEHYFNKGDAALAGAARPDPTLRVDSKVLEKAEIGETASIRQGLRGAPEGDHRRGRHPRNAPGAVPR
jgi:type III restriction enzyme